MVNLKLITGKKNEEMKPLHPPNELHASVDTGHISDRVILTLDHEQPQTQPKNEPIPTKRILTPWITGASLINQKRSTIK